MAIYNIYIILLVTFSIFGEKLTFPFSKAPIDVVIPCVEKDLCTLERCIRGIKKNGANIRRIIVVSHKRLTKRAEWYSEKYFPFSFNDIAMALANGDPDLEEKFLQTNSRTGWYFQQLLKFYAPLIIPDISENVLVLDADTIFLHPVTFLNERGGGMYNPGTEYHLPYFQHANLLIPGFQKLYPDYSGISHHMVFQKPVLIELFATVESNHVEPFWKIFCSHVQKADPTLFTGASEYEIYFNYVFPKQIKHRFGS